MKRAKIMLMTIAVLATVGTALAFKVNKFGIDTYCYLTTTQQPDQGKCTDEIQNALPNSGTGTFYKLKPAAGCSNVICNEQGAGFGI